MAHFISDEEMEKMAPQQRAPGFISDDEMHEHESKSQERPWYSVTPGGLARGAIDAIPAISTIAGGLMGNVPGAGLGYSGGKEIADTLKNRLLGDAPTSTDPVEQAKRVAGNTLNGATMEMGGQALGSAIGSAAKSLKGVGENFAVRATGATGKQAAEFAPGTGRELLDTGVVGFGNTPADVATKASAQLESKGKDIGKIIDDLTSSGVTGSRNDLVAGLQSKIDELGTDPAQAQVVKQLEGIKANVAAGPEAPTLRQIENTKKGFQGMVNWADPEGSAAKASAADMYKKKSEELIGQSDAEKARRFIEAKRGYGIMAPVAEAAERRAATTSQSPFGGLADLASVGAGGAAGGPVGGAATLLAKKALFPRVNSSVAVGADQASKFLMSRPAFQQLATKSPQAFNSLASNLSEGGSMSKVAQPGQQPVDDDKAKQSFLDGN